MRPSTVATHHQASAIVLLVVKKKKQNYFSVFKWQPTPVFLPGKFMGSQRIGHDQTLTRTHAHASIKTGMIENSLIAQ